MARTFRNDLDLVLYKWNLDTQPALLAEVFNPDGTPQAWAKPSLEQALTIEFEGSASPNWDAYYRTGQAVFAEALRRANDKERQAFNELEADYKRRMSEYEAERRRQSAELNLPDAASQRLYSSLVTSWLTTVIGEPKWMTDMRSAEQARQAAVQAEIDKYNAAEIARLRDYYVKRDAETGDYTVSTYDNLVKRVQAAVPAPPPAIAVAPVPIDVGPQLLAAAAVRAKPAADVHRAQLVRDEEEAARLRAARLERARAVAAAKAALEDPARPPRSRLAAAFDYVMALIRSGTGER